MVDQGIPYIHNRFSAVDESNLHFHGLHVSGELPSDDSTHVVGPGQRYEYQTSLPHNHMPGTHWIHPHRHGSTALQVAGGAVSALIVEDPPNSLPPQVENATEVLFLAHLVHLEEIQEITSASRDGLMAFSGSQTAPFVTVNGQVKPAISIVQGEWFRMRTIWASWLQGDLDLNIPTCEMQLLAKDGIYIRDFPRSIQTARIPPGGRADLMVRCLQPATTYPVIGLDGVTIATIQTTAAPTVQSADLQRWTPIYPEYLTDLQSATASPGCACETEFDGVGTVNGYSFDPNRGLHTSYLGAIVERLLEAQNHPYHQHVYPFQLISGFRDDGYHAVGDWHDTLAGDGVIRYQPKVFPGKIMVHCHRLDHEDQGMMSIERVNASGMTCTCVEPAGLAPEIVVAIVIGSVLVAGIAIGLIVKKYKKVDP